ncbi:hypothetical protein L1049_008263 [Liquidambar formosana]|uniref:DUF3741 domain-containing protein n=1 Tax=Liquidambar formosana TaxID=63359 RepID=A0AAP0S5W4_LIQFO
MADSQNATTKCFSGILRRLLCTGSLPTHPSDHFTEPNTTLEFEHPKKDPKTPVNVEAPPATTPGIVARLMGLESFPVPKGRSTLDPFSRSRSVNSMDFLMEFNQTQAWHRRVRTSVSFREVEPTVLHRQNHELFIFALENVDESGEFGSKQRKAEAGLGETKQRKVEKKKNKENVREKVHVKKKENVENKKKASKGKDEPRSSAVYGKQCSKVANCSGAKSVGSVLPHKNDVHRKPRENSKLKNTLKPVIQKKVTVGSKLINKKKSHHDSHLSEESRPMGLDSRRKSSPKIANYDYPSPYIARPTSNTDGLELGAIKSKDYESVKTRETTYYTELLGEIFRLTEIDVKESYWMAKEVRRFEDFEDTCMELGQDILDIELEEVVYELATYQLTSFAL